MRDWLISGKNKLPEGIKKVLKPLFPGSTLNYLRNPRVDVVSYPKCGRSWLRLLVCDCVYMSLPEKERIDDVSTQVLWKLHPLIPQMFFTHDDQPMLKTPAELVTDKSDYKDKKVLLLVRDPRDVMISWYFQVTARGAKRHFEGKEGIEFDSPARFIDNERGGLKTIVAFYNLWIEHQEIPKDFLILRYEDFHSQTEETLKRYLEFCGFSSIVTTEALHKAVEKNRFDNVKKREMSNDIQSKDNLNIFGTVAETDKPEEALKARKGKVGNYGEYLSQDEIERMNEYIRQNLNPIFGYS
jgi:hypothetical protein